MSAIRPRSRLGSFPSHPTVCAGPGVLRRAGPPSLTTAARSQRLQEAQRRSLGPIRAGGVCAHHTEPPTLVQNPWGLSLPGPDDARRGWADKTRRPPLDPSTRGGVRAAIPVKSGHPPSRVGFPGPGALRPVPRVSTPQARLSGPRCPGATSSSDSEGAPGRSNAWNAGQTRPRFHRGHGTPRGAVLPKGPGRIRPAHGVAAERFLFRRQTSQRRHARHESTSSRPRSRPRCRLARPGRFKDHEPAAGYAPVSTAGDRGVPVFSYGKRHANQGTGACRQGTGSTAPGLGFVEPFY